MRGFIRTTTAFNFARNSLQLLIHRLRLDCQPAKLYRVCTSYSIFLFWRLQNDGRLQYEDSAVSVVTNVEEHESNSSQQANNFHPHASE